MTTQSKIIGTGSLLVVIALAVSSTHAGQQWQKWNGGTEDIEFGITQNVGGMPTATISAFEIGYNGAYGVGSDIPFPGWGETFVPPATAPLLSAQLRLSSFSSETASGPLEIAVWTFDASTQQTGYRLAFDDVLAQNYNYDLTSAPQSTFDMSSFGVTLQAGSEYMLTFVPLNGFTGHAYVQSALNIYPDGETYLEVPEPSNIALIACAAAPFAIRRRVGLGDRRIAIPRQPLRASALACGG